MVGFLKFGISYCSGCVGILYKNDRVVCKAVEYGGYGHQLDIRINHAIVSAKLNKLLKK